MDSLLSGTYSFMGSLPGNPDTLQGLGMLRLFRLATSLLTRLPVGLSGVPAEGELGACAAFFPAVGYVLATFALAGPLVAMRHGPGSAAPLLAVVSVSLLAWLTRGLHLDGLADVCDGLGGGFDPARRLEIMKDSVVGAFGVIGLVLLLIAKVMALAVLFGRPGGLWTVGAAVVLARFFVVALAALGRYPRPDGTGKKIVGCVPNRGLVVAGLFCLPCAAAPGAPVMVVAMAVTMFLLRRRADKLIGGVTGDVLGACCELCETIGCIAVVLADLQG